MSIGKYIGAVVAITLSFDHQANVIAYQSFLKFDITYHAIVLRCHCLCILLPTARTSAGR